MTDLIQLARNAVNADAERNVARRVRRNLRSLLESRRMRRRLHSKTSRKANARENRSMPPSHDCCRPSKKRSGHYMRLISCWS